MRLEVGQGLAIDDSELAWRFIQAGGPGGQNVNKVATAAQLRFDVRASPSLPEGVKHRLAALAGSRMTQDGVIVITARALRTQERNREAATARLLDLILQAASPAKLRRPTRASFGERQRRLADKGRRAEIKRGRTQRPEE